jgi:hypothetical protein
MKVAITFLWSLLVWVGMMKCVGRYDEVYSDPKICKTKVQLALDSNSNHLADDATNWVNIPTLGEADSTTVVPVVNAASTVATLGYMGTIQCNTNLVESE